jgi:phosphotransferase system HPr (HPr) family protein
MHGQHHCLYKLQTNSPVTISVQNITADSAISNAKSILSVLTLGVVQGHEIEIIAEGDDAEEAIAALESLILNNFGE